MSILDSIKKRYKRVTGLDARLRIEQKVDALSEELESIKDRQVEFNKRMLAEQEESNKSNKLILSDLQALRQHRIFTERLRNLYELIREGRSGVADGLLEREVSSHLAQALRFIVRDAAGLPKEPAENDLMRDLTDEIKFIHLNAIFLKPVMQMLFAKRVLYAGQAYYNAWYLSRGLRKLGWSADVLNWDTNLSSQIYYHGQDFWFDGTDENELTKNLKFYVNSLYSYDIFHFSNAHGITFGWPIRHFFMENLGDCVEIHLLKALGKKIVYSNNGCLDGVSQSQFAKWGPESICAICIWRNRPDVCSDEKNLAWGKFRNSVADYQCLLGGNRADYNCDASIHEVPEFYCLDTEIWQPGLDIPATYRLDDKSDAIRLYHAVGNKSDRTDEDGINIKSSHIYLPLIAKLKSEGFKIDLLEPTNVPNIEVRFIQAQADIFLDMLTYGWFGANAREAMMLGKPVICYIRPSWLESLRREIPEYAEELPIISATPYNVEEILKELIINPKKRLEIGRRSRAFAEKWHSGQAGARRFDEIYTRLLLGDPLLLAGGEIESADE